MYSFSGKVIGALSWNSKEFLGIPSPVGYKLGISGNFWEFLGISRFLEPELLWLGIPRNS